MSIRSILSAFRFRLVIVVVGVTVLVVAGLWVAVVTLRPMPPHTVVMATGPEGSAYYEFGHRYRDLLGQAGIELRLLPTAGALENLARLRDPKSEVKAGFLQGGITNEKETPGLESLGTVFYEPLWFFYRGIYRGRGIEFLRGRKISIGPEGSGTRALTLKLLARNGIDQRFAELLPLTPEEAGEKLIRGEIDAALIMTSWDSDVVRQLLSDRDIDLASFPRTDAYVALYPYLNKVVVPAGVGDLAENRPSADTVLFATKASLIVRNDLHPAIQYLLLDAAEKIHSGPGIFHKGGQFPSAETVDLRLSDEARQFYKSGRPFLQRHLPFWLAALMDRLLVLLIPVVGVIYPLLRLLPGLYGWEMQRRILNLYSELRSLEREMGRRDVRQDMADLVMKLERLEDKANRLKVSLNYTNRLYTLRGHIMLVYQRLQRRQERSGDMIEGK
jgi:TRAP-type uncharacterized transport system substrate-binding protein